MRKSFLTSLLLLLSVALLAQTASEKMKKMEWLLGSWSRTNTKPDRQSTERWEKVGAGTWNGIAFNTKSADTVYVEKLKVVIENGKLYYVADVPENKKPVYFEMTSVTDKDFVCENPLHDFPKKIEYHLQPDGRLLAQISDDKKKIDYWFERKK